jgi:hypothetical protein
MKRIFILLGCALPLVSALADPIIPTTNGMTWEYAMTEEAGAGLAFSNPRPDEDGKARLTVFYRIDGTRKVDGKNLLKFEMHRAGVVTNTDLLAVDEHGIVCRARIDQSGELVKLNPAQTMVAAPLKTGASWNFDSTIDKMKIHQRYEVVGEEDVDLPAGNFHAFHIRGVQTRPSAMSIDRWFVSGVGIVKDVTTTRSENGDLVRRITLELNERPRITPKSEGKSADASKKFSASVGKSAAGDATIQFAADTPAIYARWHGHDLKKDAAIHCVWIAENVGNIAPPNYTIDEANARAEGSDSSGVFTLSRPDDGWAPGDYRVEFYVDSVLAGTVKLKIVE